MAWMFAQADAMRLPLADQSVDLAFCSPPYVDARLYLEGGSNKGISRKCEAWVEWMLSVVTEMTRVSRGLVLVNCAGVTRDRIYQPGPEGLMWEWWKRGGNLWRPAYWNRVGIPGSGGAQWLRADIEYVLCFKRDREWLPWADNTANGHKPKWALGGEMSYRLSNGDRRNQWGRHVNCRTSNRKADGTWQAGHRPSHFSANEQTTVGRRADGERKEAYFNGNGFARKVDQNNRLERGNEKGGCRSALPVLANPGNLLRVKVGGGLMGHPLAHENEAPFPVDLAAWFIRSWCPPGGIVLDCFSGSGTTVDAAWRLGRKGIGFDLRASQCELGRRRMLNPYAKKSKPKKAAPGELTLFKEIA